MKNIRKIVSLSKPLYRLTLALALLVLVMSVLQQVQPFLIKFIVDNIQQQITEQKGDLTTVSWLMLGILGVNLVATVLNSISMRFGDYINSRLRRFLTEKFYTHVFTLPQKYFDSEISGKILNRGCNRKFPCITVKTSKPLNFYIFSLRTVGNRLA